MQLEGVIMIYGEKFKAEECFSLMKLSCSSDKINYEELDISSIKFDSKTIVILCGNNTKNISRAGAYMTYCANWLKGSPLEKDCTIYSIYYPQSQPLDNGLKTNLRFDYEGLSNILFEQVIYKNSKRASVEEIVKHLSDVMFFGHSIGGYVMNEITYELGKKLKYEGFTKQEINKIFSSIVFVGYSPFALVDAPTKNIYIAPIYDSLGSVKLVCEKMEEDGTFVSSNQSVDVTKVCQSAIDSHLGFVQIYNEAINNQDTTYYANHNCLIATPNLLLDDGTQKEDHNMAGIIDHPYANQHKTRAGEITTKLIEYLFKYILLVERRKLSTKRLYNKVTKLTELLEEDDLKREK